MRLVVVTTRECRVFSCAEGNFILVPSWWYDNDDIIRIQYGRTVSDDIAEQ